MPDTQTATIGHNISPVSIPKEEEMLDDLRRRYSHLETEPAELEKALATFPEELSLERPDEAEALQDLLGRIKKTRRHWDADEKGEKGPINKLVKVVTNFFTKADDKLKGMLEVWEPRYQAFLDKKKAEAQRKMEEEAENQRKAAEAARVAREKAEKEAAEAAERAEAERLREQEARAAAERAQRQREEAEQRALAAKAEERRLAAEKAEKDRAEKESNANAIREIKAALKDAERLNTLAEADEATDDEILVLEELLRPGGGIAKGGVWGSPLMDDAQREYLDTAKARVVELREIGNARYTKREQTKRARAAEAAAAEEARLTEQRRKARADEDAKLAAAKKKREEEEAAAVAAQDDKKKAEQEARDARASARQSETGAKVAGKEAARHGADADRAENRADRVDRRLENSSDADLSQTRGDLGTVGGLTRRWAYLITDEEALRGVCGPLGEHLTTTALEGAIFHWMRARQASWTGKERVEDPALPGVVFTYEQEIRIA